MGRAPLSFADIVERVKPAVVSIHVTNGGAKTAQGRPRPQGRQPQELPRDFLPDLPDDHPLNEFFKNLPKEWRGQPSPSPRPSLAQGSGFVISADGYVVTNNHVIDGASKIQVSFDKDNKYRGGADRHRPAHRHRAPQDQGHVEAVPFVKFADKHPAHRRLGAGGRQPVRSRRLGDGRHRLGARPRHRLGPLRLHADRRGREPRQLRRPDLQPRRRGGRRQHRHLQPVGRQRRHRLRHPRQDRFGGGRAAQDRVAPSIAAGSASRSRTSTRTRRRAWG